MDKVRLSVIDNGVIEEILEVPDISCFYTVLSEYHSEDPDKEEKFEQDLKDVLSTGKLDDYDLIASQYTYSPNHLNVGKAWYFLEKGSYTRTSAEIEVGIIIKGTVYGGTNESRRVARVTEQNGKKKLRKRRGVRKGSSEKDL